MVSGSALLMDIYYPEESNQRAILLVKGSGWHGEAAYSANQLKTDEEARGYTDLLNLRDALVDQGFTLFVPNYRLAPVFRYPAAIQDLRRAVRFIRGNADRFGIEPEPFGAIGHSAGGHLVGLLALADNPGDPGAEDPVETLSSKVQAAVAISSVLDPFADTPSYVFASFVGEPPNSTTGNRALSEKWIEATPVSHISEDDPPMLVIHAKNDPVATIAWSESGVRALQEAGRDVEYISLDEGGHVPALDIDHISSWLSRNLFQ